jgi:hypothetical protein
METLSFILGIGAVLGIAGVAVLVKTVVEVNRLQKFATKLELAIADSIEKQINDNDLSVHRRIDQEIDRVNTITTNVYSAIDSRLDKLETKLTREFKQVLKG